MNNLLAQVIAEELSRAKKTQEADGDIKEGRKALLMVKDAYKNEKLSPSARIGTLKDALKRGRQANASLWGKTQELRNTHFMELEAHIELLEQIQNATSLEQVVLLSRSIPKEDFGSNVKTVRWGAKLARQFAEKQLFALATQNEEDKVGPAGEEEKE